jgi:hypothetical protein
MLAVFLFSSMNTLAQYIPESTLLAFFAVRFRTQCRCSACS